MNAKTAPTHSKTNTHTHRTLYTRAGSYSSRTVTVSWLRKADVEWEDLQTIMAM